MYLANAEDRAAGSDGKFQIPERHEREAVGVGHVVKLVFTDEEGNFGERMWVGIEQVRSDHVKPFVGMLLNEPINYGLEVSMYYDVEFGPEHIISIKPLAKV